MCVCLRLLLTCSRIALLLTLAVAPSLARPQGASPGSDRGSPGKVDRKPCDCAPPKPKPFTGRVLDAVTGKPISGAVVHYLDHNPPVDGNDRPVRRPIAGVVVSGEDGSYALPTDLPLADFRLRASAPGYYAAVIYAQQDIVGESGLRGPQHQSHDLLLRPGAGLVAIGASQLPGADRQGASLYELTAAAFSPDGASLALAGRGPTLWVVTLVDGLVRRIALPAGLTQPDMTITALAWDGNNLIFLEGNAEHTYVGGASAPDFRVASLPAPSPSQTAIRFDQPYAEIDGFVFEQKDDCQQKDAGPHCGQGAQIVARNLKTGRAELVFSAWAGALSYMHDPALGGLVAFADETHAVPGLTLLNLTTHARSRIEIPSAAGRYPNLVAERMIPPTGFKAMRLAYTTEGDCDPNATDRTQPFAPTGNIAETGLTANLWSVCVVTLPVPAQTAPKGRTTASSRSTLGQN
jgi:hypothetical protein